LLLDGVIDYIIGMAKDNRADSAYPIDVFIPIDINKAGAFGPLGIDGADAIGKLAGSAADELGPARDEFASTFVDF